MMVLANLELSTLLFWHGIKQYDGQIGMVIAMVQGGLAIFWLNWKHNGNELFGMVVKSLHFIFYKLKCTKSNIGFNRFSFKMEIAIEYTTRICHP